jgi:transcriptional regulator with XRE-family HTH domain
VKPMAHTTWTAKRVRALRARYSLTLEGMARLVGVSFYTIWRWEHGRIQMNCRHGQKLDRIERKLRRTQNGH